MSVSTNGGPAPQRHRLALNDVTKTYGSTRALKGVDLTLEAGRLQALIGPNGAGKSTIVKCLAGAITPDSGTIIAGPEEHRGFASPVQAKAAGISVVHQDPESFEDLTVAQNIVIAKLPRRGRGFWAIRDRSAANERAAEVLQMVGLDIDPREHMRRLSLADRTLVAICRAIVEDVRFLILDEPTAALGREDARRVYDVCHAVREQGAGVLVVTHRLHEVLSHATRVTALRDGLVHADQPTQSMSVEQIARLVATTGGAGVDEDRSAMREDVVVSASGLSGNGFTGPVDIELRDLAPTRVEAGLDRQCRAVERDLPAAHCGHEQRDRQQRQEERLRDAQGVGLDAARRERVDDAERQQRKNHRERRDARLPQRRDFVVSRAHAGRFKTSWTVPDTCFIHTSSHPSWPSLLSSDFSVSASTFIVQTLPFKSTTLYCQRSLAIPFLLVLQPARFPERFPQHELDLRVQRPQVVVRPALHARDDPRVDAQRECLLRRHVASTSTPRSRPAASRDPSTARRAGC